MADKECITEIDVSFELPGKLTLPCNALTSGINYDDIITLGQVELTADEYNRYEIVLPVDENYAYMFFGAIHFNGYSEKSTLKIIFDSQSYDPNTGMENTGIGGTGNNLRSFTLHAEEKQETDRYYHYNYEPVILPTMLLYTNKLILNPGGYELLHGSEGTSTSARVYLYGYVIRIKRPQSEV